MRRYLRSIARAKIKKEGVQKMNKRFTIIGKSGLPEKAPSYFAENWRAYCI